ncbi:UPF0758 family protein [hydrothermal vent metagenome]|uniref:UPF0758 family protein n=1 Tax=hydrothermal vent metagenome TaxID=652676 RepID=A0A3B0YKL5_9ZZZZ
MPLKQLPRQERPREKLLGQGAASLTDSELVAIFLRTGVKGIDVIQLARQLLKEFNGLRGLMTATKLDFCNIHGLGPAKYATLQAMLEMNRRQLKEKLMRTEIISSPECSRAFLLNELRDCTQEVFACLFLDNRNRVITFEKLFFGTINGASVHPREIIRSCLTHNAAAVILAHNHPSGVAEPSETDQQLTRQLIQTLGSVDVRVHDHVVIGDGEIVSFAERGLI